MPKTEKEEMPLEEKRHNNASNKNGWAKRMARVFAVDVMKCPKCQSAMQTISFITESKAIETVLSSLQMATAPPKKAKAFFAAEPSEPIYDEIN